MSSTDVWSDRERFGAGDGTRTRDILVGGQELYQLSYSRAIALVQAVSPLAMAIHAHDIAFFYLRGQPLAGCLSNEARYLETLRALVPVIELHHFGPK